MPIKKTIKIAKQIPDDCMPKCASCAFYECEPNDDKGVCHRYPPSVAIISDEMTMVVPAVAANEWCGEFRRRSN